jgi:CMP-N-acetylneuraminic acid synthetase
VPDVFALVTARGGSKGVPGKNIAMVAGKPLIAWSIEAGLRAACVDRVIVSTDDEAIASVARERGADVPFLRPAELARDDTPGVEPVLHALRTLAVALPWTLLLQPTSPLRTAADVDAAFALAIATGADAVLGVTAVRQHASWQRERDDDGWLRAIGEAPSTRQQLPQRYCPNGAIYLCRTSVILEQRTLTPTKTAAYEMPGSRSIDVDISDDLLLVNALLGGETSLARGKDHAT